LNVPEQVEDDGIWCAVRGDAAAGWAARRPALFLDRDGVIVEEVGYLHRPEDVGLIAGAAEVIAATNRQGTPVIVLTNQSGIGRGLYGWAEFAATEARIAADLAAQGAHLDLVIACPYHPEGKPPFRHPAHPCRKPLPGMILRAGARLDVDLPRSWIIGDRAGDLAAGRAGGLAGGLHVLTGHGPRERAEAVKLASRDFQVRHADTMAGAMELIPQLWPGQ
jgi:D-glycero-D-manno-heptose 1,7-bisphosphate phosphatase